MTITAVVDDGLGNSAYLVDIGDGRALVVDPSRDLRAIRGHADRRGLTVAFAADTHLHADFVSGAVQLAADQDALLLASAAGRRRYDHVALADGDEVDLGGLSLRAMATPGHTDEHLSFLLLDGPATLGVFTGGSLIVGGAARTDLAGPDQTEQLARAQCRSLQRLATLPDSTAVWPTHGAGSFCSAPSGAERVTTIGTEKISNPLLTAPDEDTFVERLLSGFGSYPPYFLRLAEVNRRGPDLLGEPATAALGSTQVAAQLADGAVVVDVRPVRDFASGHVPGAISIPLRAQFASWLGWLLDADTPYVVVRTPDQDITEAVWQSWKIGYQVIAGELAGGMAAWDGPTAQTPLVRADQVGAATLLDVRQDSEYDARRVPGAFHIELGAVPFRATDVPAGPVVTMCGHGERAMTAASVLQRAGHREVSVLDGGPDDVAAQPVDR